MAEGAICICRSLASTRSSIRLFRCAVAYALSGTAASNGARTCVIATPERKLALTAVSPAPFTVTRPCSSTCATVSSADWNFTHAVTSSVPPLLNRAVTLSGSTAPTLSVRSAGVTSSPTSCASPSAGPGMPVDTHRARIS